MGQSIKLSCYYPENSIIEAQAMQNKTLKLNGGYSSNVLSDNINNYNQIEYNEYYSYRISDIIAIQSYIRYHLYGQRYPIIKQKQLKEEGYLISSLLSQYTTFKTKQAESSLGYLIKPLSIKYTAKYDYGLTLYTKISIVESITPSFYIGSINIHNERHGYGSLYYQNGAKYEGHWQLNSFIGFNRFIDEEGNLYQGYFTNWYLNGTGIKCTLNCVHYSGMFVNNVKEGKGKEVTNETIYQGEFHSDKYHGTGMLKNLKENWEYQGQFANNAFEGIGIYTDTNGKKSQGEFFKGKMISNLSMSSLLTSTIESEKDQIKISLTKKNDDKTFNPPPLSSRVRDRKHFMSMS